jgi:hypothetical protein
MIAAPFPVSLYAISLPHFPRRVHPNFAAPRKNRRRRLQAGGECGTMFPAYQETMTARRRSAVEKENCNG